MHEALSQSECKTKPLRIVPGWNIKCRNLNETARVVFLRWKELGCLQSGEEFILMKNSHKHFKNAMEFVKLMISRDVSTSFRVHLAPRMMLI